jgi:pyruvate dehydrogenase E2 component (dihydrolipoamide acetyltransferase)
VPVIRGADTKALTREAREAWELVGRAREGRLAAGELTGGTLTVSNLGMFGIDQCTVVINPPEAAVLAVGAVVAEPVATAAGAVAVRRRMRLTLSIHHRALDGPPGPGSWPSSRPSGNIPSSSSPRTPVGCARRACGGPAEPAG